MNGKAVALDEYIKRAQGAENDVKILSMGDGLVRCDQLLGVAEARQPSFEITIVKMRRTISEGAEEEIMTAGYGLGLL